MEHVVDDASDSGKSLESELEEDESEYDDMSDGAQMYSTTDESSSDDDDNAVDSDDGEVCVRPHTLALYLWNLHKYLSLLTTS